MEIIASLFVGNVMVIYIFDIKAEIMLYTVIALPIISIEPQTVGATFQGILISLLSFLRIIISSIYGFLLSFILIVILSCIVPQPLKKSHCPHPTFFLRILYFVSQYGKAVLSRLIWKSAQILKTDYVFRL